VTDEQAERQPAEELVESAEIEELNPATTEEAAEDQPDASTEAGLDSSAESTEEVVESPELGDAPADPQTEDVVEEDVDDSLEEAQQPVVEASEDELDPDEGTPEDAEEVVVDAISEGEEELEQEVELDEQPDDEPSVAESEELIEEPSEVDSAAVPDDDRHWYVVHCYSGYENKVRHNLEQRIETMGMKNKIFDVVVPTEEEIEVKDGKRRTVERRVFPGYILVQMQMDEDSWYVVRNTPGVTGFVGMGNDPTPLRQEEVAQIVKRMEAEAPRIKVTYKTGQKVRIIDGPFNDFIGTVSDIDMERAKVRVMVSFFGRETPVELDFLQVEKA
jgi:transcriptional antiterminator NusG